MISCSACRNISARISRIINSSRAPGVCVANKALRCCERRALSAASANNDTRASSRRKAAAGRNAEPRAATARNHYLIEIMKPA